MAAVLERNVKIGAQVSVRSSMDRQRDACGMRKHKMLSMALQPKIWDASSQSQDGSRKSM